MMAGVADEDEEREHLTNLPRDDDPLPKPAPASARVKPPKPPRPQQSRPARPPRQPPRAEDIPAAVQTSSAEEAAAGETTEDPRIEREDGNDGGSFGATQIVTTAVRAATELAQIGFSVGRQTLRAVVERLPKL